MSIKFITVVVLTLTAAMSADSKSPVVRRDIMPRNGEYRQQAAAAPAVVNSDEVVHLPTSVEELFADVYNNNSVSLYLKAREQRYQNRTVKEIAPGAFMAYNYAMGNSLWIVTPEDTIIVVDCPENVEAAYLMRDDMRRQPAVGNKPITYIIYTIFQADHTFGARAFVEDPANNGQKPVIIGHKNLIKQAEFFDIYRFMKIRRVSRVFGSLLPRSVKIIAWVPIYVGKVLFFEFWPTVLLSMDKMGDTQDLILNGVPMQFVFLPGYTPDQMAVWFPVTRLMAGADTYYSMLPNIYTIRGEPARDALAWSKTVRIVRSYFPDVMFNNHLDPLYGREHIASVLEKVADSMQYTHDQTVRMMAKGHTPDVISRTIRLPTTLDNDPDIPQVYGGVEVNVKAVADRYTGWFNGEAEDLLPVTKDELAANMIRDFGRDAVLARAREAYGSGDYRWAATLASYVWRAENKSRNDALYWRTQALKRLAENYMGAQLRNYLYSTAMVDWGLLNDRQIANSVVRSRPVYLGLRRIENCFELLAMHVDPVRAADYDEIIDLRLTDDPDLGKNQVYRMRLRNSVLFVEKASDVDVDQPNSLRYPCVETDDQTWRQILAGKMTVDQALFTNTVRVVKYGGADIREFLDKFDFVDEE